MLFQLQFLTHNINRVGEIPLYFLEESVVRERYSQNLFPAWFRPVLKKLPAVNKRFKAVYNEINELKKTNLPELLLLIDSLTDGNNISSLCSDSSLEGPRTIFVSKNLHSALKSVFGTFFEETLKQSKTLSKAIHATYTDHYYKFRKLNFDGKGKVCPMCGIYEYPLPEHEPIAQYDHWLPQDIYPLFSINYQNLVPICGTCNNIKLSKDLIYDNVRTLSFYPYTEHDGLSFKITSHTPYSRLDKQAKEFYPHGLFKIDVTATNAADNPKIESWDRVFNIKNRWSTFISSYSDDLKSDLKNYLTDNGINISNGEPKANLARIIDRFRTNRIKLVRKERGAHLKHTFLDYLKENGNEHLLYAFFDISPV